MNNWFNSSVNHDGAKEIINDFQDELDSGNMEACIIAKGNDYKPVWVAVDGEDSESAKVRTYPLSLDEEGLVSEPAPSVGCGEIDSVFYQLPDGFSWVEVRQEMPQAVKDAI